jgi:hypothetical protein
LETDPEISEESELLTDDQRSGRMVMLDPQFGIPIEIKFVPEEKGRNSYKPYNRNDEIVMAPPPAAVKKTKNSSRFRNQNEILTNSMIADPEDDGIEKLFRNQTWIPYSSEYLGEDYQPKCRFQGLLS